MIREIFIFLLRVENINKSGNKDNRALRTSVPFFLLFILYCGKISHYALRVRIHLPVNGTSERISTDPFFKIRTSKLCTSHYLVLAPDVIHGFV